MMKAGGASKQVCAFTLIEMLVATAVLCLLSILLFSIVDASTKIWKFQEGQSDTFRETRGALNIFSRDLQNSIRTTNAAWFSAGTNRFAFLTSLPITEQPTNDASDICTVGYSLEWGKADTNNAQENPSYSLYRYVQFSNPTFSNTLGSGGSVSAIFNEADPATTENPSTVRELVARNIISMQCTPYSTNATGDLLPLPAGAQTGTPDVFELALSTIGDTTAKRLTSQAAWEDTNSLSIRQNQQTFTLRVHLSRPAPLPTP